MVSRFVGSPAALRKKERSPTVVMAGIGTARRKETRK